MTWTELYPIVKNQADFAILRYEEAERRKDKMSELVAQSYEKYQRDVQAGKEVRKQDYKCFVTQRAKEVDTRSICKDGLGGTSVIDVTSFYRRRPDQLPFVQFDEFMTTNQSRRKNVDDMLAFNIDFPAFLEKLNDAQRIVLNYLIEGFKINQIAEELKTKITKVTEIIKNIRKLFISFFHVTVQAV